MVLPQGGVIVLICLRAVEERGGRGDGGSDAGSLEIRRKDGSSSGVRDHSQVSLLTALT